MAKEKKTMKGKTIKPGKNIIASMVQGLKDQVLSLINQGIKDITMDFKGIEDIDSNGLGFLIAARNSLKSVGGSLKIKNASEKIYKFLQTVRLDKHFEIVSHG